jgi:hypothetical protein
VDLDLATGMSCWHVLLGPASPPRAGVDAMAKEPQGLLNAKCGARGTLSRGLAAWNLEHWNWNLEKLGTWKSTGCDQLRDQRSQGGVLLPPVRPLGPVRSWVGLAVVRGVQLGPWAAGFGGR